MALTVKHNNVEFGIGDRIRVVQKIKEGERDRLQSFEGVVIRIKGREENKSFTVRRIGVQQIGIERIFPLESPSINEIEKVKEGVRGTRRAKLYYIREKSRREFEKIYSRAKKRAEAKEKGLKEKTKSKKLKDNSKKLTSKSSNKKTNNAPKKK